MTTMKKQVKLGELRNIIRMIIKESKGKWTGLGTDTPIYNRHEPKPRSLKKQTDRTNILAASLWNAATEHDRSQFLNSEAGGYEKEDCVGRACRCSSSGRCVWCARW